MMWLALVILVIVVVPLWLLCLKFGALEPTGFGARPEEQRDDNARVVAALVVTSVGVLGGGYLVFSDAIFVDAVENLAAGVVGLVVGYWLR